MTIVFGIESDQKKVQHKFEFAFNLKKPQASRHALGPAALGYGGVPSFNLNNIKMNPRKNKNIFNFVLQNLLVFQQSKVKGIFFSWIRFYIV